MSSPSPSWHRISTSAEQSHQLNSFTQFAPILNDVSSLSVGSTFLQLHRLLAYNAAQQIDQGAFIVVQMTSARFVGLLEKLWRKLKLSQSFYSRSRKALKR
jgi:hypothetical protein